MPCEYFGFIPPVVPLADASAGPGALAAPSPLTETSAEEERSPSAAAELSDPRVQSLFELPCPYPLRCARAAALPPKPPGSLRFVLISDTHERHRDVRTPAGDVLIHCGDIQQGVSLSRTAHAVKDFFRWLNDPALHPHPVKLCVAGNHDRWLARQGPERARALAAPALYLEDESALLLPAGLRVYASPRSVRNSRASPNRAFQGSGHWADPRPPPAETEAAAAADREGPLRAVREGAAPRGPVDVLVTHQACEPRADLDGQRIFASLRALRPRRLHCCGHLHGTRGLMRLPASATSGGVRTPADAGGGAAVVPRPMLPSLNAAMVKTSGFKYVVQSALVVDVML